MVSWRSSRDDYHSEITKTESRYDDWLIVGLHLQVGLPKGILLLLGMNNPSAEVVFNYGLLFEA
jgi:hypothetical protein